MKNDPQNHCRITDGFTVIWRGHRDFLMGLNPAMVSLLILALTATVGSAHAEGLGIPLHGNDRGASACVIFVGAHDEGMPAKGFPRLARLDAGYL